MFVALPLLLLALFVHLSACSAGAASSASKAPRLSETTEINGRLCYRHTLIPVEYYSEDNRNESKQAVLKETLDPLLIDPLIEIVADYSCASGSCSLQRSCMQSF